MFTINLPRVGGIIMLLGCLESSHADLQSRLICSKNVLVCLIKIRCKYAEADVGKVQSSPDLIGFFHDLPVYMSSLFYPSVPLAPSSVSSSSPLCVHQGHACLRLISSLFLLKSPNLSPSCSLWPLFKSIQSNELIWKPPIF